MKQWEHLFSDGVAFVRSCVRPSVRGWSSVTSFESKLQESVAIDISEKLVRAIFDIVDKFWETSKSSKYPKSKFFEIFKIDDFGIVFENNSILWSVGISLKTIPYCGQLGFREVIHNMELFSVWRQKKNLPAAGWGELILPSRLPPMFELKKFFACAVGAPHPLIHRKVL